MQLFGQQFPFLFFFGVLIYLKVPQKINSSLISQINAIKKELDEAKKLKVEAKNLLSNYESKIEKELGAIEEEIKVLKKSSVSNINHIATETTAEIIKQIINTEVNKSSVSAIVNDVTKRQMEKQI